MGLTESINEGGSSERERAAAERKSQLDELGVCADLVLETPAEDSPENVLESLDELEGIIDKMEDDFTIKRVGLSESKADDLEDTLRIWPGTSMEERIEILKEPFPNTSSESLGKIAILFQAALEHPHIGAPFSPTRFDSWGVGKGYVRKLLNLLDSEDAISLIRRWNVRENEVQKAQIAVKMMGNFNFSRLNLSKGDADKLGDKILGASNDEKIGILRKKLFFDHTSDEQLVKVARLFEEVISMGDPKIEKQDVSPEFLSNVINLLDNRDAQNFIKKLT